MSLENPDSFFGINTKLAKQRKQICDSCEYKKTTLKVETCSKCGCVIVFKVKLDRSKCPISKW